MASLHAFPLSRRRDLVARCAMRMAALPAATADKHLAHQLKIQADTMHRRGFTSAAIDAEVRTLESAIRAELWRHVLTPEGAA